MGGVRQDDDDRGEEHTYSPGVNVNPKRGDYDFNNSSTREKTDRNRLTELDMQKIKAWLRRNS